MTKLKSDTTTTYLKQKPTIKSIPHFDLLNAYQQVLLTHFPTQIEQLILFGSQARGEASSESDIDVLVVVNWEEKKLPDGRYLAPFSDPRWQSIITLAYDLSLDYGVMLAPYIISKKRLAEWSPLTEEIKQDGIEIWAKNQTQLKL